MRWQNIALTKQHLPRLPALVAHRQSGRHCRVELWLGVMAPDCACATPASTPYLSRIMTTRV